MVGHQHLTRGHVVDLREGDHCVHTAARHPGASPPPADKWIKKRHFLSVIYLSLNGLTIHCMRRDWLLILSLMLGTPSTFILPYSAPPSHNNRIKMYAMFLPCTHIHSIVSIRGSQEFVTSWRGRQGTHCIVPFSDALAVPYA